MTFHLADIDEDNEEEAASDLRFSILPRGETGWHMKSGSLQQSVVIAFCIAAMNGTFCWIYYECLEWSLEMVWHTLPKLLWQGFPDWMWIPVTVLAGALLTGLSVLCLGEPGDLAFTIACVHSKSAYIPIPHIFPMGAASFFSIVVAAASVGPEAPLVAMCGAVAGWISRAVFHERNAAVTRKHTLMGMAGALSAFFGVPIGGSLFALEVTSRFGMEYYEHMMPAIFCGELTLIVYRTLTGISPKPLWDMGVPSLPAADSWGIAVGGLLGLLGAGMAYAFALFHAHLMKLFAQAGLLDNSKAIWRACIGAMGIIVTGLLVPQTMFWSEIEIECVVARSPAITLPHVWPTAGLIGFEEDAAWKTALVGVVKLVAISFSIAGGFRGGFIFPLMMAGGAVGRAIADWTGLPIQLGILCVAAGLTTSITRTALSNTLVLAFLSGEQNATPAILMASLSSLFATGYLVFIKTQIARSDVDHTLFHDASHQT